MNFEQKKQQTIDSVFKNILGKDKEYLTKVRKAEQVKLSCLSEQSIVANIPLSDNEDLLIQSLIVDELLFLEQTTIKVVEKISLIDESKLDIV